MEPNKIYEDRIKTRSTYSATVNKWVEEFRPGWDSIENDPRSDRSKM